MRKARKRLVLGDGEDAVNEDPNSEDEGLGEDYDDDGCSADDADGGLPNGPAGDDIGLFNIPDPHLGGELGAALDLDPGELASSSGS
jgi:hypothetical protein